MNLGHKSDINLKVIVRLFKSNQDMNTFKNKSCYENCLSSKVIYFMRRTSDLNLYLYRDLQGYMMLFR